MGFVPLPLSGNLELFRALALPRGELIPLHLLDYPQVRPSHLRLANVQEDHRCAIEVSRTGLAMRMDCLRYLVATKGGRWRSGSWEGC